jgi:hypothetical protein
MPKELYLVEIKSALVEVEADSAEDAERIFDDLIAPIAERGTVAYRGPVLESEYCYEEADQ